MKKSESQLVVPPCPEEIWKGLFEEVCERIGPVFERSETRERVKSYFQGLLSPIKRKNSWQLAEEMGELNPYGVQYLLNRARWDADKMRDIVLEYVREKLGDENGVGALDETGFIKKGNKSVGVQRQYSGAAGRIENSQIGVFLSYTSIFGRYIARSSNVSSKELDTGSEAMSRGEHSRRGKVCNKAGACDTADKASFRCKNTNKLVCRRQCLWKLKEASSIFRRATKGTCMSSYLSRAGSERRKAAASGCALLRL